MGLLKVINGIIYLNLSTKDTLRFQGQLYGSSITGSIYSLFLSMNRNGVVNWARQIKNGGVSEINLYNDSELWLTLTCGLSGGVDALDFRYDGLYYPRTLWGNNYFQINPINGNVLLNFPTTFLRPSNYAMTGQYVNGNDSTFYTIYRLINSDSLLINGKYYTKRSKDVYYHDYLLAKVKANPPVQPIKKLNLTALGGNKMKVSWITDSSYSKDNMGILVFAKKDSMMNIGSNNTDPIFMIPINNFSISGTSYPNDAFAKCVYIGDDNQMIITGLEPLTKYYVSAFVVRDFDYIYSTPITSFASTLSLQPPSPYTLNLSVAGQRAAKVTWRKPKDYTDSTMDVYVFLKENNPIDGIDSSFRDSMAYASDSVFTKGSMLANDTNAYCIYKGDREEVTVTNLVRGKTYYLMAYVIRETDSMNSRTALWNQIYAAPPVYPIHQISTTDLTNGNPDSLNVYVRIRGVTYGFNDATANVLNFVIKDLSGGIRIKGSYTSDYSFKERDSLEVEGIVTTDRGNVMIDVDTIIYFTNNYPLQSPKKSKIITETEENDWISIDTLSFLKKPSGTKWGMADTLYKLVDKEKDTILLELSSRSGLAGQSLPQSIYFSVRGVGKQISSDYKAPYAFNGYRIVPGTTADITDVFIPDSLSPFYLLSPANTSVINLSGDPGVNVLFNWSHSIKGDSLLNRIYHIQFSSSNGFFGSPQYTDLSSMSGKDSFFRINKGALAVALGLTSGMNQTLKWRIEANAGTFHLYSDTFSVIMNRGIFIGLPQLTESEPVLIYPNPFSNEVHILSSEVVESIELSDPLGRVVFIQLKPERTLNLSNLGQGTYIMKVIMKNSIRILKVVKEE
jgi:hypothetical protein